MFFSFSLNTLLKHTTQNVPDVTNDIQIRIRIVAITVTLNLIYLVIWFSGLVVNPKNQGKAAGHSETHL